MLLGRRHLKGKNRRRMRGSYLIRGRGRFIAVNGRTTVFCPIVVSTDHRFGLCLPVCLSVYPVFCVTLCLGRVGAGVCGIFVAYTRLVQKIRFWFAAGGQVFAARAAVYLSRVAGGSTQNELCYQSSYTLLLRSVGKLC